MRHSEFLIALIVPALLFRPATVNAQTNTPATQTPSLEEQMKTQCSSVQRNPDGTWTINGKIELHNRGSVVSGGHGDRIGHGISLDGTDIADLFEKVCAAHQT